MNQTTNYELKLYEGTDLFNPLTVENVNFTDIDTAMKGISDAAVSAATELLTGTVHAITRTDSDRDIFVFPATANYAAGETFTVDGTQVTALLPSGTTLPTGAYVIGSNVLCVLNGTLMTVFCDAGADAQTLQGHAASYFATDSDLDDLTTTVGNISTKVGSAVLTTTAPDLSGAVNELNSNLTQIIQDEIWVKKYESTSIKIYVRKGEAMIEFEGQSSAGSTEGNIVGNIQNLGGAPLPLITQYAEMNGCAVKINANGNLSCMASDYSTYITHSIIGTMIYVTN